MRCVRKEELGFASGAGMSSESWGRLVDEDGSSGEGAMIILFVAWPFTFTLKYRMWRWW